MLNNINDYLPIGSVVLLKNGTKKLMVFGILQSDKDHPEVEYDYIGVPYPEGNMGVEYQYLFHQKDIINIFYRGFESTERQEFMGSLSDFYKNRATKKIKIKK